VELTQIKNTY